MSEISTAELKKQLSNGEIHNLYIFYGDEGYLREHYVKQLRIAVLGAEDDPFNCHRFDGREMNLGELSDAIDAFPSFARRSYIEVRDCDLFKATEENLKQLEHILSDLPDYCCLVFIYDTVEYKPDKRKKLNAVIQENAHCVNIPAQEQSALVKWIEKHFGHYGKKISRENAQYMIFLCGELMNSLNNEIVKVAFYAQEETVTRRDIDAAASPVIDAVAYELINELSAKNYDKAAQVMDKLFQLSEEPIQLLALIGSQLRKMFGAYIIKRAGGKISDVKEMLSLRSDYQAKLLYNNCTAFSDRWYRENLQLCAQTDMKMKSSGGDPEELLISLFLFMSGRGYRTDA